MSKKTLGLLAALVTIPSTALAATDEIGPAGRIVALEVNQQSSDTYLQYHGRVWIGKGKAVVEYRWGGTSCGSRTLMPDGVQLLQTALANGLVVQPRYEDGQGTTLCLVGFTFSD